MPVQSLNRAAENGSMCRLVLCGICVLLVMSPAGCASKPSSGLVTEWLSDTACSPPCVMGITPGRSSFDDVLKALRANPAVGEIETHPTDSISWRWANVAAISTESPVVRGGSVAFYSITNYTEAQRISIVWPRSLTLTETIKAFGAPSHVFAWAMRYPHDLTRATNHLEILWLDRGFGMLWRAPRVGADYDVFHVPDLGSDREFYSAIFFDPAFPPHAGKLVPWKGIVQFSEYCTGCPHDDFP